MQSVCTKNNIGFYDLNDGVPLLTNNDFQNFDHLNKRGAEKLSRYLSREILPRYLTENAAPNPSHSIPNHPPE
jgi:hypothetical protein